MVETAARLDPGLAMLQAALAYASGMGGQPDRARVITASLIERTRADGKGFFSLAIARMGINDYDATLTALERAVDQHDIGLTQFSMTIDPKWDPLRSSPRFTRILERMNLGQYSRR